MNDTFLEGRILKFDEIRGYGFVAPDGGGEDVFLHVNDLAVDKERIRAGVRVAFLREEGERGYKASRVRLCADEPPRPVAQAERTTADAEDGLCDVLAPEALRIEVTERLLRALPDLPAAHVLRIREEMVELAHDHDWLEA